MSDIMDALKDLLKVFAYVVPAFLILLGFALGVFGWTFGFITDDVGMRNLGIFLIIAGIVMYLPEIYLFNKGKYTYTPAKDKPTSVRFQ